MNKTWIDWDKFEMIYSAPQDDTDHLISEDRAECGRPSHLGTGVEEYEFSKGDRGPK